MTCENPVGSPLLFTKENIHTLTFPQTEDGDYARRYLLPMIINGVQKYISNAHNTRMMAAKIDDVIFPITVTDFHIENTYTCSPYSHYVSYGALDEVKRLNNPPIEALIKLAMRPIAWYLRQSEFDKVAYVNNWLVSTNLYPPIAADQLRALCEALPKWFPDRPIVFRSVDEFQNPTVVHTLRELGYEMLLSRQVWYLDPQVGTSLKVHREDLRAIHKNGHAEGGDLHENEIARGVELYNLLYLEKYSYYNPQFTSEFLKLAYNEKLLSVKTVRRDGRLNAIMGYFSRNGVMTPSLFGYDTSLPKTDALYRHLTVLTMREAKERGLMLHDSSGVGKFKKKRGAKKVIEYNAVFTKHLPLRRQLPWKLIGLVSKAAIPLFRKNDF
jgi:hypothetical protein